MSRELGLGTIDVKAYSPTLDVKEDGEFLARVAAFGNVDRYGDRLMPGAFKASLERWAQRSAFIPVVYQHAWGEPPIGHVLEAAEDEQGLVVRSTLYHEDDPLAAKVLRGLRRKSLSEFSFAFEVKEAALVLQGDDVIRELRAVDVIEVGPCLRGVNPETELLAVKSRLLERKAGRTLSKQTLQRLRTIASELSTFCDEHDAPAPDPPAAEDAGAKARAQQRDWLTRRRVAFIPA